MQLIRDKWYSIEYAGVKENAKYLGTIESDNVEYVFAFVATRKDGTTYPCTLTYNDYFVETRVKEIQE
jgi:hypothetical protein